MRTPEVGKQTFYKVRKSQIRKFLGSFRYHKPANFFGVQSAIRKFLQNTSQICLKTILNVFFVKVFYVQIWLELICYIYKEKKYVFAVLRKFLVRKSQKDWARKSQIRKVLHLRKVRKSN
jgi:hypothetical protein